MCMALPHIPSSVFLPLLHTSQNAWNTTFAARRVFWMQMFLVASVRYVESLDSCNGMRVNDLRWRDAVLPIFLHLGVHY